MRDHESPGTTEPREPDMELHDLRICVDRIEGRSVCGLQVGDYIDVVRSNEMRLPEGKHFCMYAFAAALPMLAAKQRNLPADDWMSKDSHVACPDPEERLVMRIDRTGTRRLRSEDLT
ncbi:TIGR04076 family protein [Kineococcus sp. SYSU DK018]|uniref:TIGR04076 family protein n=1 Tax=Kineococcus sp. SYSU DK018 TaxID=3383139 RepID=UPI003D7D88A6